MSQSIDEIDCLHLECINESEQIHINAFKIDRIGCGIHLAFILSLTICLMKIKS